MFLMGWSVGLLEGFEEEAEEDVGEEEDEGEDDGAAQASPGAHAFRFFLFLGFLFACGFLFGSGSVGRCAAITREPCVAVGGFCLFHALFMGWGCAGLVFGRCVRVKVDTGILALALLVASCGDSGLRHGLTSLQQALRAHNHAVIGNELLVADFQFFSAFRTSPAHYILNFWQNLKV